MFVSNQDILSLSEVSEAVFFKHQNVIVYGEKNSLSEVSWWAAWRVRRNAYLHTDVHLHAMFPLGWFVLSGTHVCLNHTCSFSWL